MFTIAKPWQVSDVDVIVNSLDTLSAADADALIDTALLLLSRPVAQYVVTFAVDGDDRTAGLRRMGRAEADRVLGFAARAGMSGRVVSA